MDQRHPWVGVDEGTVEVRILREPVVPEPARHGEDPTSCKACTAIADAFEVYRDDTWRVKVLEDTAFAGTCLLMPLRHVDGVASLTDAELSSYGPMVARVSQAVLALAPEASFRGAGVGRVHSHLWNDGEAHLHQWFFPRPLGYLDLLGSVLVEWEETLPRAAPEQVAAAAADLRSRLNP